MELSPPSFASISALSHPDHRYAETSTFEGAIPWSTSQSSEIPPLGDSKDATADGNAQASHWTSNLLGDKRLGDSVQHEIRCLSSPCELPYGILRPAVAHATDRRVGAKPSRQHCDHCGLVKPLDLNQDPQHKSSEYPESDRSTSPPPCSGGEFLREWSPHRYAAISRNERSGVKVPATPVLGLRTPSQNDVSPWATLLTPAADSSALQTKLKMRFSMKRLYVMLRGGNVDRGRGIIDEISEDLHSWQMVERRSKSIFSDDRASLGLDIYSERTTTTYIASTRSSLATAASTPHLSTVETTTAGNHGTYNTSCRFARRTLMHPRDIDARKRTVPTNRRP